MARRFYLSNRTDTRAITPSGSWEKTTGFLRRTALLEAQSNAFATLAIAAQGTTGNDTLGIQFISPPLSGAQTVGAGTVKGQLIGRESTLALDGRAQIIMRVVQSDLSTVRGTLLAEDVAALANEYTTTLTNRFFPRTPGTALTSVAAQDGDVIVIEIGSRQHATQAGNFEWRYGDASASDLPENETATTDANPWIEVTDTLTFQNNSKARATWEGAEVLYAPDSGDVKARVTQEVVEVLYSDSGAVTTRFSVIWID